MVTTVTSATGKGELPKQLESQAASDRRKAYALHDFELPISLAKLGNTKGPGGVHAAFVQAYMARKAHIEATCGVQVSALVFYVLHVITPLFEGIMFPKTQILNFVLGSSSPDLV